VKRGEFVRSGDRGVENAWRSIGTLRASPFKSTSSVICLYIPSSPLHLPYTASRLDTSVTGTPPRRDRQHPAGYPGASVCCRHGGRDARAKGRSEHVSVEGAQGADSPGDAPDTFLPPGTSSYFCLDGGIHTTTSWFGRLPSLLRECAEGYVPTAHFGPGRRNRKPVLLPCA
jgi:hypothetical protein